jgi:hypothetical protein
LAGSSALFAEDRYYDVHDVTAAKPRKARKGKELHFHLEEITHPEPGENS